MLEPEEVTQDAERGGASGGGGGGGRRWEDDLYIPPEILDSPHDFIDYENPGFLLLFAQESGLKVKEDPEEVAADAGKGGGGWKRRGEELNIPPEMLDSPANFIDYPGSLLLPSQETGQQAEEEPEEEDANHEKDLEDKKRLKRKQQKAKAKQTKSGGNRIKQAKATRKGIETESKEERGVGSYQLRKNRRKSYFWDIYVNEFEDEEEEEDSKEGMRSLGRKGKARTSSDRQKRFSKGKGKGKDGDKVSRKATNRLTGCSPKRSPKTEEGKPKSSCQRLEHAGKPVIAPATGATVAAVEEKEAERIIGIVADRGELLLHVKWKGLPREEAQLMPNHVVNIKWPHLVIEFYQSRHKFVSV